MKKCVYVLWLLAACGSDGAPAADDNDAGSGGAAAAGGSAGASAGGGGSALAGVDGGLDASAGGVGIDAGGIDAGALAGSGEAQLPPTNRKALEAWIEKGFYKAWKCESSVMKARPNGAHGRNRVCSNALASANAGGPYAVGAASIKEIYSGDKISVYAASVKVKEGTAANTWYWYEGSIEGIGISACAGCHAQSAQYGGHDYVYIQVK
ncbi:MAG: hypothetical protein SF187_01095 [Deltaproteobacteria bacterium]|nr:hypothetical protein [Deltaproteobacteria bacterium]